MSSNEKDSDSQDSCNDFKVKEEADDQCNDQSSAASERTNSQASSPEHIPLNDLNSGSTNSNQLKRTIAGKKMNVVQDIVEGLLKKSDSLLTASKGSSLKPKQRKQKGGQENVLKNPEPPFPEQDQSCVFPISKNKQARVSKPGHAAKKQVDKDSVKPKLLRPKSPTRKSDYVLKDKTQFSYALMESMVTDSEVERVFKVQNHEIVCGVGSKNLMADCDDQVLASLDMGYFWCNFCPFTTSSKASFTSHIKEHRFACRFCPYESFCRSDILRHMNKCHEEFSDTANHFFYCTILSDYLRVKAWADGKENNQPPVDPDNDVDPIDAAKNENETSNRKRKLKDNECENESSSSSKNRRVSEEADNSNSSSRKERQGKSRKSQNPRRHPQAQDSDFSTFEVSIEETTELSLQDSNNSNEADHDQRFVYNYTQDDLPSLNSSDFKPASDTGTVSLPEPSPSQKEPNTSAQPNHSSSTSRHSRNKHAPMNPASLYWSCGYCSFESTSQALIKDHSNLDHLGKPHRYVAQIKNSAPDNVIPENSSRSGSKNDANKSTSVSAAGSPAPSNGSRNGDEAEDGASMNEFEDTDSMLKVRFAPPKARRDFRVMRCYHCNYTAKRHSAMKTHLLYKHKGDALIAVDSETEAGLMTFFCARDDCSFKTQKVPLYMVHLDQCTPWHNQGLSDVEVEPHVRLCLEKTVMFASLAVNQVAPIHILAVDCMAETMLQPDAEGSHPEDTICTSESESDSEDERDNASDDDKGEDVQFLDSDEEIQLTSRVEMKANAAAVQTDNKQLEDSANSSERTSSHEDTSSKSANSKKERRDDSVDGGMTDVHFSKDSESSGTQGSEAECAQTKTDLSEESAVSSVSACDVSGKSDRSPTGMVLGSCPSESSIVHVDCTSEETVDDQSEFASGWANQGTVNVQADSPLEEGGKNQAGIGSGNNIQSVGKVETKTAVSQENTRSGTVIVYDAQGNSDIDRIRSLLKYRHPLRISKSAGTNSDKREAVESRQQAAEPEGHYVQMVALSSEKEELSASGTELKQEIETDSTEQSSGASSTSGSGTSGSGTSGSSGSGSSGTSRSSTSGLSGSGTTGTTVNSNLTVEVISGQELVVQKTKVAVSDEEKEDRAGVDLKEMDRQVENEKDEMSEAEDFKAEGSEAMLIASKEQKEEKSIVLEEEKCKAIEPSDKEQQDRDIYNDDSSRDEVIQEGKMLKNEGCHSSKEEDFDILDASPHNEEECSDAKEEIGYENDQGEGKFDTHIEETDRGNEEEEMQDLEKDLEMSADEDENMSCAENYPDEFEDVKDKEDDEENDILNSSIRSNNSFLPVGVLDVREEEVDGRSRSVSPVDDVTADVDELVFAEPHHSGSPEQNHSSCEPSTIHGRSIDEPEVHGQSFLQYSASSEASSRPTTKTHSSGSTELTSTSLGRSHENVNEFLDESIKEGLLTPRASSSPLKIKLKFTGKGSLNYSIDPEIREERSGDDLGHEQRAVIDIKREQRTSVDTEGGDAAKGDLREHTTSSSSSSNSSDSDDGDMSSSSTSDSSDSDDEVSKKVSHSPKESCHSPKQQSPQQVLPQTARSQDMPQQAIGRVEVEDQPVVDPPWLKELIDSTGDSDSDGMPSNPRSTPLSVSTVHDSCENSLDGSTTQRETDSVKLEERSEKVKANIQSPDAFQTISQAAVNQWKDENLSEQSNTTPVSTLKVTSKTQSNTSAASAFKVTSETIHVRDRSLSKAAKQTKTSGSRFKVTSETIGIENRSEPYSDKPSSSGKKSSKRPSAAKDKPKLYFSVVPARSAAVKALTKMKEEDLKEEIELEDGRESPAAKVKKLSGGRSRTNSVKSVSSKSSSFAQESSQFTPAGVEGASYGPNTSSPKYNCKYCTDANQSSLSEVKSHVLTRHSSLPPMVVNLQKKSGRRKNFFICPRQGCYKLLASEGQLASHKESHSGSSKGPRSRVTQNSLSTARSHSPAQSKQGVKKNPSKAESSEKLKSCRVQLNAIDVSQLPGRPFKHLRREEKKYQCLYCTDFVFDDTLAGMKSHYSREHEAQLMVMRDTEARRAQQQSRIYVCEHPSCDFHSVVRSELYNHSKTHLVSNVTYVYECAGCGWYSSSHPLAVQHLKAEHSDEENVSLVQMALSVDEYGQTSKKVVE